MIRADAHAHAGVYYYAYIIVANCVFVARNYCNFALYLRVVILLTRRSASSCSTVAYIVVREMLELPVRTVWRPHMRTLGARITDTHFDSVHRR